MGEAIEAYELKRWPEGSQAEKVERAQMIQGANQSTIVSLAPLGLGFAWRDGRWVKPASLAAGPRCRAYKTSDRPD